MILPNCESECDFELIVARIKALLALEGVTPLDFKLDNSPLYDGIAVTFNQQFPALQAPVQYRIHYSDSPIYGVDCCFAGSIGVPRSIVDLSVSDCVKIASKCNKPSNTIISFEPYHGGKRLGAFHVMYCISGKHVLEVDDMRNCLYQVRRLIADIANAIFMKSAESFVAGVIGSSGSVAKFKQTNSIYEDDRVIISRDTFDDDLRYGYSDPIDDRDTVDCTELFSKYSELFID